MSPLAYPAVADSAASAADSAAGPAADSAAADSAATSAAEAADDPPAERGPLGRRTDSPWSWIRPSDWRRPSRTPWARS